MQEERLSVVYSGNIVEADMVRSLLEGQSIKVFLEDETPGEAVKVLVPNGSRDEARIIVEDFMESSA